MAPSTRNADRSASTEAGPAARREPERERVGTEDTEDSERPATPNPIEDIDDTVALRQRHAALRAQLTRKRLEREIQDMEDEVEGREPTQYIEIEGTMLPARKRSSSVTGSEDASLAKYIKLAQPPRFDGKSIERLLKYDRGWRKLFRTMPSIAEDEYASRIRYAASFLEDRAEEAWDRDNPELTQWADYITYLKGVVANPAIRKSQAFLRLAETKQQANQSVRDLLNKIEAIEGEIPSMTEDERKAWVLLNSLSPALRAEVMHEHKEILSREQVLSSAQRHEEVIKQRAKSEASTRAGNSTPSSRSSVSLPPRPRTVVAPKTQEKTSSTTEKKEELATTKGSGSRFPGTCHNCGKPGHMARVCRAPKKRSSGETHAKDDDQPKN